MNGSHPHFMSSLLQVFLSRFELFLANDFSNGSFVYTFLTQKSQSKNNRTLNDFKSSVQLVNSKKEKVSIKLQANQSRYLDMLTASRLTKTVKFHIHDITSPFKFPSRKSVLDYYRRTNCTMPCVQRTSSKEIIS